MICNKCNKDQPESNFYKRSGRPGKFQAYCKQCNLENTLKRQRNFKIKCVEYKGGKCQDCGYNRSIAALEFHHRNPKEKSFDFSHVRLTSWDKNEEKIISELDKCDLICANCHRERHEK